MTLDCVAGSFAGRAAALRARAYRNSKGLARRATARRIDRRRRHDLLLGGCRTDTARARAYDLKLQHPLNLL